MEPFICHRDSNMLVVWKPSGMLVHPSSLAPDKKTLLRWVRREVGQRVFPLNRIDRQASGMVAFALTSESASILSEQFRTHKVRKAYLAVVRGYFPDHLQSLQFPVKAKGQTSAPIGESLFLCLARTEKPWAIGRYAQSRYSLVLCEPVTGRRHQLRRHLDHLRYPILGDRIYGDRHHNHYLHRNTVHGRLLLFSCLLEIKARNESDPLRVWPRQFEDLNQVLADFFQLEWNSELIDMIWDKWSRFEIPMLQKEDESLGGPKSENSFRK